jgi:hypothetical protein
LTDAARTFRAGLGESGAEPNLAILNAEHSELP